MDIMIAGAGTVGYSLAQTLSHKHNVIVVDKETQTLNRLDDDIDVMTLLGDIEDPQTFQKSNIGSLDLFIAVTDSDEANLLSTLIIDDVMHVKKKIIRLKNAYFEKGAVLTKLAVDEAVFPDDLTAQKVSALFDFPKANNVKVFIHTEHKLISVRVQNSEGLNYRVEDFTRDSVVVMGIEREKSFFVPKPTDAVLMNDLVYFFGSSEQIETMADKLNTQMPSSIKRVAIFGANPLAQKIAKALLHKNLEIKIIDKNRTYCKTASECLQDEVTVIHSAYEDHSLFEKAGLKNSDMIIAAGLDDEKNIVKCIEAKEYGIEKVVSINNDKSYYNLMHKLGIIVVRGSKAGAYYAILEKIASSSIIAQRHYCGRKAVLFMRKINPNSPLIGKTLKTDKKQNRSLFLLREDTIHSCNDMLRLLEGDTVLISGKTEQEDELKKWIYTL
ncbi:MAG TPA: potassium transporter [Sulfurovum sp.]|nr:potassium transporter [Sulfurovum sp.]